MLLSGDPIDDGVLVFSDKGLHLFSLGSSFFSIMFGIISSKIHQRGVRREKNESVNIISDDIKKRRRKIYFG